MHNSLKLSFANIWVWGLRFNFVDCKFFLESNCPDILTLCETNLDDSIDSSNISGRGYLPLIRKDSNTHMHGLTVYVKEGLSFAWDVSLENSADSYLCFWLALFHAVLTSFPYIDHLPHLYAWFLILFHLTQIKFSQSTHLLFFFVFGDFNIYHKDWLTSSGETDWSGELSSNFSISDDPILNILVLIGTVFVIFERCSTGGYL